MCGLFGMMFTAATKSHHRKKAIRLFNSLAVNSVKRGDHATGAAVLQREPKSYIHKDVLPSPVIVDTHDWKTFLHTFVTKDTAMLMGHTRFGTHGENVPGNAHPFSFYTDDFGELVGTHNGMILNHDDLLPPDTTVYESDSANLFWALAQVPEAGFVPILQQAWGSFALVFRRGSQVYFARNSSSPLFVARIPELGAMVYASEAKIIKNSAKVLGLRTSKPQELNVNRLYALDVHTLKERTVSFTPVEEQFSLEGVLERGKEKVKSWSKQYLSRV